MTSIYTAADDTAHGGLHDAKQSERTSDDTLKLSPAADGTTAESSVVQLCRDGLSSELYVGQAIQMELETALWKQAEAK